MSTISPHAQKSKVYTIYALVDPRDSAIRYIGYTEDVYSRMRQHSRCMGTNAGKNAWIQELQNEQLMFIMHSLEKVKTSEQALVRESYWIQYYIGHGASLLNLAKMQEDQKPQVASSGFVRYSTAGFLCKLYFRGVSGDLICFTKASMREFAEYLDRYAEHDWSQEDLDSQFSKWDASGFRCKVLNQLRLEGYSLELFNHRGERVTDLVGNPLKPQTQSRRF